MSQSDVGTLIRNPIEFHKDTIQTVPMVIGGYFHTLVLEPNKIEKYKIIEATSRNTKLYKELSDGEICLLEAEADKIEAMRETLLANDVVRGMIQDGNVEYEVPMISRIAGELWKGKADILNHDEKIIIDLKTTSDITKFRSSAYRWNYDAQAFIYEHLFGYDFIFIAIDKKTHQIGVYDCSSKFIENGREKVNEALANYRLFHKNGEFDAKNYFINETL